MSSTLYGYAQLRQRRPQSLAVISALVSRAQSLVGRGACSPRCTSVILWALATLFGGNNNSSSSKDMPVNIFVAAAARQLASEDVDFDALGSQGVANSLWGAVKLGCRHEELLGKATEWLAANAGRCKMQVCSVGGVSSRAAVICILSAAGMIEWGVYGVGCRVWPYSFLQVQDCSLLKTESLLVVQGSRVLVCTCCLLVCSTCLFSPQEVLNILWAAGACRHRPLQLGSIVAHVAQHAEVRAWNTHRAEADLPAS